MINVSTETGSALVCSITHLNVMSERKAPCRAFLFSRLGRRISMADNRPRLFLLDAYALIYRAYYAFIRNPITNSKDKYLSSLRRYGNLERFD